MQADGPLILIGGLRRNPPRLVASGRGGARRHAITMPPRGERGRCVEVQNAVPSGHWQTTTSCRHATTQPCTEHDATLHHACNLRAVEGRKGALKSGTGLAGVAGELAASRM